MPEGIPKEQGSTLKLILKCGVVSFGIGLFRIARSVVLEGHVRRDDLIDAAGLSIVTFALFLLVFVVFRRKHL